VFFTNNSLDRSLWSYDPATGTRTEVSLTGTVPQTGSFAVLENELYWATYTYGNTRIEFYRFSGGTWVKQFNVGTGSTGEVDVENFEAYKKVELVAWNGVLYLLCCGRIGSETQDGLRIYKYETTNGLVTSSDETDLNAAVPTDLRSGYTARTMRYFDVQAIADYDTNPTSPSLYFILCKNRYTGGSWLYYEWEGESTPMSGGGVIGTTGMAWSQTKDGGGERWWTEESVSIEITSREVGYGGLQYSFIAYGDPLILDHGTTSVGSGFEVGETVQDQTTLATATIFRVNTTALTLEIGNVSGTFGNNVVKQTTGTGINTQATVSSTSGGGADYKVNQYHSELEEPPITKGTLTGGVTGGTASRSGDDIINVIADGLTEYTFLWAFGTDELSIGAHFTDKLQILPE